VCVAEGAMRAADPAARRAGLDEAGEAELERLEAKLRAARDG